MTAVGRPTGTRTSLAREVADVLESQILDERLRPGARLGLRTDLIDRFGVGSSVIKQALGILRELLARLQLTHDERAVRVTS